MKYKNILSFYSGFFTFGIFSIYNNIYQLKQIEKDFWVSLLESGKPKVCKTVKGEK